MQEDSKRESMRPHWDFISVLILITGLSIAGWIGFNSYQKKRIAAFEKKARVADLSSSAHAALISRKWAEAHQAYRAIQEMEPDSLIALKGFEQIEQGRRQELNQQIVYTLGESQAALEAGQWDEARRLAESVFGLSPHHEGAKRKLELIEMEKHRQKVMIKSSAISAALETGDPESAQQALHQLRELAPQHPHISDFEKRVNRDLEILRQRRQSAQQRYQQALALDQGVYSPEAIAHLEEALGLHPESPMIQALYKKMSSYTRALHVPADYPSIPEAIKAARPRDIIRVSAGLYQTPIVITKPIKLQGDIQGGSTIKIAAKEASVISVKATAPGTHISGFSLQHSGFDYDVNRHSAITIEAINVSVNACEIDHAAGHGIAIVDGAHAKISGCKITRSGWDGISIYGEKSHAEIFDTVCMENLQQGIGFWNGGSGSVTQSKTIKNGLCGILAMSQGRKVTLHANTSNSNRGAGLLLSDGIMAELKSNVCENNLLSGIVGRGKGTTMKLVGNSSNDNHEVGILIHKGARAEEFTNNRSTGNKGRQTRIEKH